MIMHSTHIWTYVTIPGVHRGVHQVRSEVAGLGFGLGFGLEEVFMFDSESENRHGAVESVSEARAF